MSSARKRAAKRAPRKSAPKASRKKAATRTAKGASRKPKKTAPKKAAKAAPRKPRAASKAKPKTSAPKKGKVAKSSRGAARPGAGPKSSPRTRAPERSRKTPKRDSAGAKRAARPAPRRTAARQPEGGSRERKPGLGIKWTCFECGAKFYDLNRPEPTCPRCGTDQRTRPQLSDSEPAPSAPVRRPALAPMSRLLEEEEPDSDFQEEDEAAELDIEALEEGTGYLEGVEEEED